MKKPGISTTQSPTIQVDNEIFQILKQRQTSLQTRRDERVTMNDVLRAAFGLEPSCGHHEYKRVKGIARCAYATCPNYYAKFVRVQNGRLIPK